MEWQHFDSYGCDSDNLGKNAALYFDLFESWHLLKLELWREKILLLIECWKQNGELSEENVEEA